MFDTDSQYVNPLDKWSWFPVDFLMNVSEQNL